MALCRKKKSSQRMTVWKKKKKRSRSDYLLDDFRWASRRLSSKSQQLSCCYMSYFCGSFPNLLFAYTRKILTSSLHLHVRFIQLRGEKKHSWAAQLKQHRPVLPVTRSVREVGISEAGLLAHVHSQKNQRQILTFAARIFTDVRGEPSYWNAKNSFASSAYIFPFSLIFKYIK